VAWRVVASVISTVTGEFTNTKLTIFINSAAFDSCVSVFVSTVTPGLTKRKLLPATHFVLKE